MKKCSFDGCHNRIRLCDEICDECAVKLEAELEALYLECLLKDNLAGAARVRCCLEGATE